MDLFLRKSLAQLQREADGEHRLRRVLGVGMLTAMGIAAITGAGIFAQPGILARNITGPGIMVSYLITGFAMYLMALCYAEWAGMAPVSGSAYTYALLTFGELPAWTIGWDILAEYVLASAVVAHAWSEYLQNLLRQFGLQVPQVHALIDLPAILIVGALTWLLVKGIKESATTNALMVAIKVSVILFVIALGSRFIHPANWTPFAPYGWGGLGGGGNGILRGAAMAVYAFLGFEAISTHSEEARNAKKDVPRAILLSLGLCTLLYEGVAAVLTGMVPYNQVSEKAPLAEAFSHVGMPWAQIIIDVSALIGLTSVLLVVLLSAARVLLALGREGLIPERFFGAVHPVHHTPANATVAVGVAVLFLGLIPGGILMELVAIGTLFAFLIVAGGVLVMRKINPHAERTVRVPILVPIGGIALCLLLMSSLPASNWLRLFVWQAIGMLIYVMYGYRHSKLRRASQVKLVR